MDADPTGRGPIDGAADESSGSRADADVGD